MRVKLQPASSSKLPAFSPLTPPAVISQMLLLDNPHKVRSGICASREMGALELQVGSLAGGENCIEVLVWLGCWWNVPCWSLFSFGADWKSCGPREWSTHSLAPWNPLERWGQPVVLAGLHLRAAKVWEDTQGVFLAPPVFVVPEGRGQGMPVTQAYLTWVELTYTYCYLLTA